MAAASRYTPILTGKAGEFRALADLPAEILDGLLPLIDMPPPPAERKGAKSAPKSPERRLDELVSCVNQPWARGRPVAIDLLAYEGLALERHAVALLAERAEWQAADVRIAVRTDAPASYREAAAVAAAASGRACIRAMVQPSARGADTAAAVDALRAELGLEPDAVELVLDLGHLGRFATEPGTTVANALAAVRDHLGVLPYRDRWSELVVASTNAPSYDDVDRSNPKRFPRLDWRLWAALNANAPAGRAPGFGDYGVTGPRPEEPPIGNPHPNIRYTTKAALLVWKGRRVDDEAPDDERGEAMTFRDLCGELVEHDDWEGPDFSPGDLAYAQTHAGEESAETATKWVEFATSHHLVHVVNALRGER